MDLWTENGTSNYSERVRANVVAISRVKRVGGDAKMQFRDNGSTIRPSARNLLIEMRDNFRK